ncbi:MAG: hypothetical protein ACXWEF_04165 [Solirubrobacterales bacterium]
MAVRAESNVARPGVLTRIQVALRRRALDRALARGVDPLESPSLAVRAARSTSRRNRERLASSIEAMLIAATNPQPALSAAVQPSRAVIDVARLPLLQIETMLRAERPVYCQGVARLQLLLFDGASALYYPTRAGEPTDELERIIASLRGDPGR